LSFYDKFPMKIPNTKRIEMDEEGILYFGNHSFNFVFLSQFQTISWAYTKKGFGKKKTKTEDKKELR
jgi:hypothetical protein